MRRVNARAFEDRRLVEAKAAATAWAVVESPRSSPPTGPASRRRRWPTRSTGTPRRSTRGKDRGGRDQAHRAHQARLPRSDSAAGQRGAHARPGGVARQDAEDGQPGRRAANMLRNVFTATRDEWHWRGESPVQGLQGSGDDPARTRRVNPSEVKLICRWLGYRTGVVEGTIPGPPGKRPKGRDGCASSRRPSPCACWLLHADTALALIRRSRTGS